MPPDDTAVILFEASVTVIDAICGDGILTSPEEECDDGSANSNTEPDACRVDCNLASCGDGTVDAGEECDAGKYLVGFVSS